MFILLREKFCFWLLCKIDFWFLPVSLLRKIFVWSGLKPDSQPAERLI